MIIICYSHVKRLLISILGHAISVLTPSAHYSSVDRIYGGKFSKRKFFRHNKKIIIQIGILLIILRPLRFMIHDY